MSNKLISTVGQLILLFLIVAEANSDERTRLKIKAMIHHVFDGYLRFAFPMDELSPISCKGVGLNRTQPQASTLFNINTGVLLTLIDGLDTLAICQDWHRFEHGLLLISAEFTKHAPAFFAIDNEVLTFEINIRVLGGLLSLYNIIATRSDLKRIPAIQQCRDLLVHMARDLGTRLSKAFTQSPTGIPYSKINLKTGEASQPFTNTASAGTYILEFGSLSLITGDWSFYAIAKAALRALWDRRNLQTNLVGSEINVETGLWTNPVVSLGAGVDSYWEYLYKGYLAFGDSDLLDWYQKGTQGLDIRGYEFGQPFRVNMDGSSIMPSYLSVAFDALGAFWPGLHCLAGNIDAAIKSFDIYHYSTRRLGHGAFLPESFRLDTVETLFGPSLLRPELIESAWYLFQATKDVRYQRYALNVVEFLETNAKSACGYFSFRDLAALSRADSMDSFFLSETLKYLYLIFDRDNWIHNENFLLSTEANPIVPNANPTVPEVDPIMPKTVPSCKQLWTSTFIDKYGNWRGRVAQHFGYETESTCPLPLFNKPSPLLQSVTVSFAIDNLPSSASAMASASTISINVEIANIEPGRTYHIAFIDSALLELLNRWCPATMALGMFKDEADNFFSKFKSRIPVIIFPYEARTYSKTLARLALQFT